MSDGLALQGYGFGNIPGTNGGQLYLVGTDIEFDGPVRGVGGGQFYGAPVVFFPTNQLAGSITTTISTLGIKCGNAVCDGDVWQDASDRNLKENLASVDTLNVLEKVAALPISQWNYKGKASTQHVGPMAQDFYGVFGLGTDDKHIATIDAQGVALAAIQGLNKKVDEKDSRIHQLENENKALAQRLSDLEQLVKKISENK